MLLHNAVPCSGRWHLQQLALAICPIIMVLWTATYLDQGVDISRRRPNYRFYYLWPMNAKLQCSELGFSLVVLSFKMSWKAKCFDQGFKFQVVLVCVAIIFKILPFLTSPLNSFISSFFPQRFPNPLFYLISSLILVLMWIVSHHQLRRSRFLDDGGFPPKRR